ncbi:MAG TPA: hypothetical protein VMD02_05475 [Candidatus Omnitrophota bacterium]|nr:hypothetical protein [Candidatus Omnitrophota bacterium]
MRYVIWGPVAGLVIAAILFTFGAFGTDINLSLIAAVVLIVAGLIVGWFMDNKLSA